MKFPLLLQSAYFFCPLCPVCLSLSPSIHKEAPRWRHTGLLRGSDPFWCPKWCVGCPRVTFSDRRLFTLLISHPRGIRCESGAEVIDYGWLSSKKLSYRIKFRLTKAPKISNDAKNFFSRKFCAPKILSSEYFSDKVTYIWVTLLTHFRLSMNTHQSSASIDHGEAVQKVHVTVNFYWLVEFKSPEREKSTKVREGKSIYTMGLSKIMLFV